MAERALMVLPTDALGGAESRLKLIAEQLLGRGFFVDVVFLSKSVAQGWSDLPSERTSLHFTTISDSRLGTIPGMLRILSLARNNRFKFTFASNTRINGLLGIFKGLGLLNCGLLIVRESTLILDRFGGWKQKIYRLLYRFGYHHSDLIICQTNLMMNRLLNEIAQSKNWNMHAIPNPIDRSNLESLSKREFTWSIPISKYLVGVGRLIKLKGFDLLIEALALSGHDDLHLVILGDGPEREHLVDHAKAQGLSDRLHLPGHLPNPYPIMSLASACVVSSRIEGFPNVLLEMMALNETVISTECAGGIKEIAGLFTCIPNSAKAMTGAIQEGMRFVDTQSKVERRSLFDAELSTRTPKLFVDQILKLVGC